MLLPSQALVKANSVASRLIDPFTEHRLTLPSLSQLPSAPSLSQLPNQGRSALYWRQEDEVGGQATGPKVFLSAYLHGPATNGHRQKPVQPGEVLSCIIRWYSLLVINVYIPLGCYCCLLMLLL